MDAWKPLPKDRWNRATAAHLLRRAGFGGTPDDLDQAVKGGLDDTLSWLLAGCRPTSSDPLDQVARKLQGGAFTSSYYVVESLQGAWAHRLVNAASPLRERLTLYWHSHFATGQQKVAKAEWMRDQIHTLRQHCLGPFRDTLRAMTRDKAMLRWLDGDKNVKGHPNENYARELFELFSLGIGHYTEADVKESARAFTGWRLSEDGAVSFDASKHDDGVKVVLGKRGRLRGDDVIDRVLELPACATYLARRLFSHFAYTGADDALVRPMAEKIRADGYRFGGALRLLFRSQEFYSERAVLRQIKSPCEFATGAVLALGARYPAQQLAKDMAEMGQSLYFPPSVKGWDGGRSWVSSAALFARQKFARALVTGGGGGGKYVDLLTPVRTAKTDAERVRIYLERLLPGQRHPGLERRLTGFLSGIDGAPRARMAELVHLILSLPEYQLA